MKQWNERAKVHSAKSSEFYDLESFLKGKSTLLPIEKNTLGDIKNKKLLHAQCHIGLDSISLGWLGAKVTGVDFSADAIQKAKQFAKHFQLPITFIQSNIFDLPKTTIEKESFDIVYASYGVLCWIDNLDAWTRTLASYLKKGGTFLLIDGHPLISMVELENNKYEIQYSYFKNKEPFEFDDGQTYTGDKLEVKTAYEWNHSIDEIIMSFIKAGLTITSFYEYDFNFWKRFPFLAKSSDGYYYRDPNIPTVPQYNLPFMFSLTATK